MEPFTKLNGLVALLDLPNVDTDQIIPKQFLKRIERTGFGQFLFYDWRFIDGKQLNPEFEMNADRYKGATILVTRANFGCGSSREHAPWSLLDYGFKCLIAPSFADIFYNNCFKNGMLPIVLSEDQIETIFQRTRAREGYRLNVDLEKREIASSDGLLFQFDVDPFRRHCLLNGLDDIGLTLQQEEKISAYEKTRAWV
ncbi:3-isopropylmalate dehydratase small subunit [Candidatus Manganitrophus noduliformans]|uniref:3-isopropylmalate dehydratase small subunit n=1 Tax=Candidatus Manganitrophus noduliformans TaxID=2606439 RepID=A0A7X6ICI2_9BACT|nr:3-isopropylmalate dehydratase small subunit [Candidatus Manganitrophus noduliformans]NKE72576.1 3-isopropylmalate dehydratase small subunit [Candidatus Manganitrophus noduliformans]